MRVAPAWDVHAWDVHAWDAHEWDAHEWDVHAWTNILYGWDFEVVRASLNLIARVARSARSLEVRG